MRAGIVSVFDNENLGNKLQNYALQQTLLKYADAVLTIKNKPKPKDPIEHIFRASVLAESVWANQMLRKYRKAETLRFHHKYLCGNRTSYCHEKQHRSLKSADVCELYCAGSDQVWNPNLGRSGMFNYLGFADYDATFSYAASFGIDRIPAEYEEDVRKGLQHIKYISVREDAGKRIVEELTGRTDVQVLVDPTMLLSTEEWDKVASKPMADVPEKYLLTYFLGDISPERENAIREKAEQLGCGIIALMDKNSPFYAIGPDAFLYLVRHAALVCTDSFHGSVFSFLYQRPLAVFNREGGQDDMGSRLKTLTSKFHLESSMVKENQIPDSVLTADYSAGYEVLAREKEKSKAFLDMVFREAEKVGLCR